MPTHWRLLAALLTLSPSVVNAQTGPSEPAAPEAPVTMEVAAQFLGTYVTFQELDQLIISRHANSELGRETRLFMLKMRLVESLAQELGVTATEDELQSMLDDVEKDVRKEGRASSIERYLEIKGVPRDEFLESLRLAILQQKLARRGLGIPEGKPVSGEQQEMWLDARISERGLEELPAPWNDNLVLRNGNVVLLRDEYIPFLRERLDPDVIQAMLIDMLRVKRMRARMPDLDPKALNQALESEIEGRRAEVAKDAKYKGLAYEQLLASQGILVESWKQDPNIVLAALARLWVQRNHDDQSLRAVYENERAYFDAEFGEALEASACFLRAAEIPNDLIPDDHDSAERKLLEIARTIKNKADFVKAVNLRSQDRKSRERNGVLGWVTRTGTSGPSPARSALFEALDSERFKPTDPADSITRMIGPVRTDSGVLLLWVGQRRPKPSWTTMMVYVHRTLRERFITEAVDAELVVTYLQPE